MEVDVIILSNTTNENLFNILKQAVNTLHESEKNYKFNVIVVESNKNLSSTFTTKLNEIRARFIIPKADFNYNLFLNIGIRESKSDYIVIANNDLIFYSNWFSEIVTQFNNDRELMSVSPIDRQWFRHSENIFNSSNEIYIGNKTSFEFAGWCFVIKREVLKALGSFDERFSFYYQDNDWVNLYNLHNIKHGLCTKSNVHHLLSKSIDILKGAEAKIYSMEFHHKIYADKWNKAGVKKYKRLSVLICSLKNRENYLQRLISRLKTQVNHEVEVLISSDNGETLIGKKRNDLINQATGEYIAFVDDDDWVSENYIEQILRATDTKPDVVGFNSIYLLNGNNPKRVENTLKHKVWGQKDGIINNVSQPITFYRSPNHLTPIKKSIALKIMFPETSFQEDRYYSLAIPSFVETENYIDDYLYFYDCKTNKTPNIPAAELQRVLDYEKKYVELAESYIKMNV